jgi:type IV secretory pathway ATPase VirB11/archaellum biosynthesis ATPase
MLERPWNTMRYEEEIIVDFDEEKSKVMSEYISIIRQIEQIMSTPAVFGHPDDEHFGKRKKALKDFYDYLFMNPLLAAQSLRDYKEEYPARQIFVQGYNTFYAWVNGILKTYTGSKLYKLTEQAGDLRAAFLSLLGLHSLQFSHNFVLSVPPGSTLISDKSSSYSLDFGLNVKIYEVPNSETNLYVQENPVLDSLPKPLQKMLQTTIAEGLKETKEVEDYTTIFENRMRQFRQDFTDRAALENTPITPSQALAMGREAAAWTVGLGAPLENISLDREYITDIYIDSENAPLYLEHSRFGLCHTLYRYNHELLEHAFLNILATTKNRRFDTSNPVIDIVLRRLNMRCHLQRPPATFGEMQGAFRVTKETPFTYVQYLNYSSFTPFFAGYDDTLVSLGCSEAVLGLKGVGKTAFTAAKIAAVGPKRRILPIQDIEEIPTRAYRKRGFHIGAMRVQSSDKEEAGSSELDLISMANASLRMGDACVIINEIRSRLAVQGVINLLNTQPGIFLLYNLHAESLHDVQSRLELVFGIPAASMFSTDRYTFLKKVRFGRKSVVYRMVGSAYESDIEKHKFEEVFSLERGDSIETTTLACKFLKNPEANQKTLSNMSVAKMEKALSIEFLPPALVRHSSEAGIAPEQYLLQSFFKGKIYSMIQDAATKLGDPQLREIDFVLKCTAASNNMLRRMEAQRGAIEYKDAEAEWDASFKTILQQDLAQRASDRASSGAAPAAPAQPAPPSTRRARPPAQ